MAMNMTPSEIRAGLMTYWNTNFTDTPTKWPNVKFPDNLKKAPFVSFDIQYAGSKTVLKGSGNTTRHMGALYIDIRVPMMSGTKYGYELTDTVMDLIARQRITYNGNSLTTESPTLHRTQEDDEYYIFPISVSFRTT